MVDLGDPTGELDGTVLKISQLLVPPLPPTGVRVRVWASSLNFADLLQAQVRPLHRELAGASCAMRAHAAARQQKRHGQRCIADSRPKIVICNVQASTAWDICCGPGGHAPCAACSACAALCGC